MDQANEQSVINTPAAAPENAAETNHVEESHVENESTAGKEFDAREIGGMKQDDQFAALKAAGIFNDNADAEPENKTEPKEETKLTEQSEPMVTVKVNGQEMQVKQSELIAGYQRGADYTRKTQELAAERKRYDELLNKVASGSQNVEPQPELKPADVIKEQYAAAQAAAEKMLGIPEGDFNQFDATHQYALQQAILQQNAENMTRSQIVQEINDFVAQAQQDPMAPAIDENFDNYIFRMGAESPEGQQKAMVLMAAKARFMSGKATKQDTVLLKGHWDYVRTALTAAQNVVPTPQKPTIKPPATEAPGTGRAAENRARLDKTKLGTLRGDDQLAYLKKIGVF